jgi:hypothetical protein
MRVFCDVYDVLSDHTDFGLDDISRAMIARNNVTSQGAIGDEALRRSTRKDRSRDPIYNQSKMYAELFRTLGWIQSLPNASLRYTFSLLGDHMATASNKAPLMRECLLGIAYPNEVLGVLSDQTVRVIGGILLQAMPRGLPRGTLCWVSKGAPSTPLVKGGVQCPAREVERRATCGASLLLKIGPQPDRKKS